VIEFYGPWSSTKIFEIIKLYVYQQPDNIQPSSTSKNIEKKIAISEEIKFKTVQKEIQVINNYDHKTISGL
jgi:hypothetical protein